MTQAMISRNMLRMKMQKSSDKTLPSKARMMLYRQRMRSAGLRPVQIWVPDTRSHHFVDACKSQSLALSKSDPGGDEIMRLLDDVSDWSDI